MAITPKIISYDVEIKSTSKHWTQRVPEVSTSDLHSVQFRFNLLDVTEAELIEGAAVSTIEITSKDGSFFQYVGETGLEGTTVIYDMKEAEGNHAGLSKIQLILKLGTSEFASSEYDFKIVNGLRDRVPVQVYVQSWETLTTQANAYLTQMAQDIEEFDVALETGVLETNIAAKLIELQTTYAPRLLSVEQQLEHKAEQSQADSLQGQVTAIVLQGTSGDSSAEVAASRVDRIGSVFPTVKSHFDNIERILTEGMARWALADWVQGAISNTTGLDSVSTTRIRTAGFHAIPSGKIINVKVSSGYRIIVNYYNESQVFQATYGWSTADFTLNPNYPYYRFMIAKVVDETAVVDWANYVTFEYVENVFVGDKSITELKLSDGAVTPKIASFMDVTYSANKFDKTKATTGFYLAYGSGNKTANASYAYSAPITCTPQQTQSLWAGSDYQICYFDVNGVYLSGELMGSTDYDFVTPLNCASYVISFNIARLNDLMVVDGAVRPTAYVPYSETYGLSHRYIPNGYGRVYVVNKEQGSQFTTISAACAVASDGDTILVYPGVYEESIDVRSKEVSIVGINKKDCILKSISNSYDYPPLEASRGWIHNMTIYAEKVAGTPNPADGRMPYAIHLDYSYSKDGKFVVDNCDVKSDWNAALGVGFKSGFKLHLKNSDISSTADTVNGAFFFHDADVESQMGTAELIVDGCNFRAPNIVLMPTSYGNVLNTLNMTWYRSMIYSTLNGKTNAAVGVGRAVTGTGWRTYNNFFLTADSFGNNHALFNVV